MAVESVKQNSRVGSNIEKRSLCMDAYELP